MDATQHRDLAPAARDALKQKLRWRLNRLRCMSPAEVAHRGFRAALTLYEKITLQNAKSIPAPDLSARGHPWVKLPRGVDQAQIVAAAERMLQGWFDVFALHGVELGAPPRWNRDPKTGIEAPLGFGKQLDYRDQDLVGDIKYLWEPNRHLHLVTLAQAYVLTKKPRYLEAITEHLESWFIACPCPLGPNWAAALEPAMRLINWSVTWQLIGGYDSVLFAKQTDFRDRWLRSVYEHCDFVRGWFSLHSSANNHLIGEAAGLFIGALTWPHWEKSADWAGAAKRVLERETLAQNAPDGVNREQATAYQSLELDLLLFCLLAGKASKQWFSPGYESRIEAMLDFVASIMDCGGNAPMFGDSDDGCVVRFSPAAGFSPFRSLLATGAILFRRGDFKVKAKRVDDKTRWLLGDGAEAEFQALDSEKTRLPPRQQFPDGGYYVLGCEFETANEIRVVADAGPLGYLSIAAHGHADALSFTLSAGGREFLVDPGTYAYHTNPRWRDYFRGTAAHNTIRIDGLDQSVAGGNFMWLEHARAGCSLWLSSAEKDTFEGWHNGYLRLPDPVKHRRLIELDKRGRRLIVEDTLEMEEEHEVELFFHCGERCQVDAVSGGYVLTQEGISLVMTLPVLEGATMEVYRGSVSPIAGWVSRSFDLRTPAPTIAWRARIAGRAVLRSAITVPQIAAVRPVRERRAVARV